MVFLICFLVLPANGKQTLTIKKNYSYSIFILKLVGLFKMWVYWAKFWAILTAEEVKNSRLTFWRNTHTTQTQSYHHCQPYLDKAQFVWNHQENSSGIWLIFSQSVILKKVNNEFINKSWKKNSITLNDIYTSNTK